MNLDSFSKMAQRIFTPEGSELMLTTLDAVENNKEVRDEFMKFQDELIELSGKYSNGAVMLGLIGPLIQLLDELRVLKESVTTPSTTTIQ